MTYSEILPLLSPEDKLKAEMYAVSRLLVQKGFCSEYEYHGHVTDWFRKTHGSQLPKRFYFLASRVCEHYGITVQQMSERNNSAKICFPRQVFMYLCRALTDASFPMIGKYLAKDHATVMYAVEKIQSLRNADKDLDCFLRSSSLAFNERYGAE